MLTYLDGCEVLDPHPGQAGRAGQAELPGLEAELAALEARPLEQGRAGQGAGVPQDVVSPGPGQRVVHQGLPGRGRVGEPLREHRRSGAGGEGWGAAAPRAAAVVAVVLWTDDEGQLRPPGRARPGWVARQGVGVAGRHTLHRDDVAVHGEVNGRLEVFKKLVQVYLYCRGETIPSL